MRFSELLDLGTLEVEKDGKKVRTFKQEDGDRLPFQAFPALLERAHARKQDAVEAEGLRWQIEKKDNEIVEMKKQLRAAKDDVSNIKVGLLPS